jgi:hypothetical protein
MPMGTPNPKEKPTARRLLEALNAGFEANTGINAIR